MFLFPKSVNIKIKIIIYYKYSMFIVKQYGSSSSLENSENSLTSPELNLLYDRYLYLFNNLYFLSSDKYFLFKCRVIKTQNV